SAERRKGSSTGAPFSASRQRPGKKKEPPDGRQSDGSLPPASTRSRQNGRSALLFRTHGGTEPSDRHLGRQCPERRRSRPSRCGNRISTLGAGEPTSRGVEQKVNCSEHSRFSSRLATSSWDMGG